MTYKDKSLPRLGSLGVWALMMLTVLLGLAAGSCKRQKTYRIGVSQCSLDDWRVKLNNEIEREMIFHPDAEVEIRSADDNAEKQKADIRYFADNGFDIIIASPVETEAVTPVINEALAKGVPVMTFDRQVAGDGYTAHIGADNNMIGRAAGDYVGRHLNGRGKIAEIAGSVTSSPARDRHTGLVQALKAYPGVQLVATSWADWTPATARKKADLLLDAHPDLDAVVAQNDRMAIAVRQAARERGMDQLVVTGVDAVGSVGIQAVADKDIDATFYYPTGGYEIIREAMHIVKGEPYKRDMVLAPATSVDAANVDMIQMQEETMREDTRKILALKEKVNTYSTRQAEQRALTIAILCILLLSAGFIFVLLRAYWSHRRGQYELALQNHRLAVQNDQLEKQKEELEAQKAAITEQRDQLTELNAKVNEATAAKLAFFTNVSHDLRTPLTLIGEPLRQLSDAKNLTPEQHLMVALADKNVKILMRLINQILDFRKYENGKMQLDLAEVDPRDYFKAWTEAFEPLALKRHIKLRLDDLWPEDATLALDLEKMERVFFNIMSNAFKFTPPNGAITVSVGEVGNKLEVKVRDNGKGMNADDLKRVFERFYQAGEVRPGGSGIGLAVSKAFAVLHGGDITVESTSGQGSVFTVTIPVQHVEKSREEHPDSQLAKIGRHEINAELGDPEDNCPVELGDGPCVLVIDDNPDIRLMLKQLLSDEYTVLEAPDGKSGIKMATRYLPDAVVCDVMMPGMDGMECCRRLKEETATSHIPVLLLTACALDEQRRQGYEHGADGYLSKPFSGDVVKARVKSLIANRNLITDSMADGHRQQGAGLQKPDPAKAQTADLDTDFYRAFTEIVEKELANSELTTEEVADRLGFSRTQLYRKLKALTNFSPNELIRNMRLKKARHLLATTEDTVSEVAYAVGFNSPSYFTKCFKERYGELPVDVQKRTLKS